MPLDLKVLFYKKGISHAKKEFEPFWWNKKELQQKYKFDSKLDMGYQDFELTIDAEQLSKIHQSQLANTEKYDEQWNITKRLAEFTKLVEDADQYEKIVVWIYEWESGM